MITHPKLWLFSFIAFFVMNSCNTTLDFIKLEQECFYKKESIREVYLVNHWRDNSENEKIIDDFACQLLEKSVNDNTFVKFIFYKVTRKTNIEYLKKHPNHMTHSYVNDYLWHYTYHKKKNLNRKFSKTKLKNMKGRQFFFPEVQCTF